MKHSKDNQINQKLLFARVYEEAAGKTIPEEARPVFHLTPYVGWMNDPNGFSFYKGEYHLFYQYNPYDVKWDSMHWGHAVSRNLLQWNYLPASLVPDETYDSFGCFSGSAAELPDGRQLLLYTGVQKTGTGDSAEEIQTQCIAVGDGLNYEKSDANPVLTVKDVPAGLSPKDFRDPKLWKEPDGSFRCVIGACTEEGHLGTILLFSSPDGFTWKYESILVQNDGRFGLMWECPDFFPLDGKHVFLCSPQDMLPEGLEYHNGNGTLCLIGELDEEGKHFRWEHHQAVDYGIDFYAPQTILAPDGRRIMIGWMQNWDTSKDTEAFKRPWFGQMSLPREISIKNGRLYQQPIRELQTFRCNPVAYENVVLNGETQLDGIAGRTVEMELTIRPKEGAEMYHKFSICFAKNDQFQTSLSYRPFESVLKIDRKFSGSRRAFIHQRRCQVPSRNGELKLRIILDRFSVEVFINDGEQVMTATIPTALDATEISFCAIGEAVVDVVKYDLKPDGANKNTI